MEIANNSSVYEVGKLVAEMEKFRLYICFKDGEDRECLLQIAISPENNSDLIRSAHILRELEKFSNEAEEGYSKVKTNPDSLLNYNLGFPELVDSFLSDSSQGSRQINILAFRNIERVSKIVPLINITRKDQLRVDLRTSIWIMGKYLKLLTLTQTNGIHIGTVTSDNILIVPDEHYVIVFDFSNAIFYSGKIPSDLRSKEISDGAKAVITALGGSWEIRCFPRDEKTEDGFASYTQYLLSLANEEQNDATEAHKNFYQLIDRFWEKKFHPFTTKPLNSIERN